MQPETGAPASSANIENLPTTFGDVLSSVSTIPSPTDAQRADLVRAIEVNWGPNCLEHYIPYPYFPMPNKYGSGSDARFDKSGADWPVLTLRALKQLSSIEKDAPKIQNGIAEAIAWRRNKFPDSWAYVQPKDISAMMDAWRNGKTIKECLDQKDAIPRPSPSKLNKRKYTKSNAPLAIQQTAPPEIPFAMHFPTSEQRPSIERNLDRPPSNGGFHRAPTGAPQSIQIPFNCKTMPHETIEPPDKRARVSSVGSPFHPWTQPLSTFSETPPFEPSIKTEDTTDVPVVVIPDENDDEDEEELDDEIAETRLMLKLRRLEKEKKQREKARKAKKASDNGNK